MYYEQNIVKLFNDKNNIYKDYNNILLIFSKNKTSYRAMFRLHLILRSITCKNVIC